jgi:hypothetical protein
MKRSFSIFTFLILSSMTFVAMSANASEGGAGSGGGGNAMTPQGCILNALLNIDHPDGTDLFYEITNCHATTEQTLCALRTVSAIQSPGKSAVFTKDVLKPKLDVCFDPTAIKF